MDMSQGLMRIAQLHDKLSKLRPLNDGEVKRLLEEFSVRNTYNSNAIEGNTLTLRETALVISEKITIAEHSLKEHLEAVGHKEAFDFVVELSQKSSVLSLYDIKQIHSLVLMGDRLNAGVYRRVPVMIMGAAHTPPQPYMIEPLMEKLLQDYQEGGAFFDKLSHLHMDFERIHPFIDGNGRTGRLILNLELLKNGYYPIDIKCTDKSRYYNALAEYDKTGNADVFKEMLVEYELNELERYVAIVKNAVEREDEEMDFEP